MRTFYLLWVGLSLVGACILTLITAFLPAKPHMVALQESIRSNPKFERVKYEMDLPGPTVNPVPGMVSWVEDLSERDPPICTEDGPYILAVVMSAVGNFAQRARVRETWAKPELSHYTGIRAVFVLGTAENDTLMEPLQKEMEDYEDIIQNDFIDSYRNLTYKTISWLSWVNDWCPNTPHIAKIDDDVIVNPFNLLLYLHQHLRRNPSASEIHGRVRFRAKPMRHNKWSVTKEEYPDDQYPPFVLGSAYIVDRNAVGPLLAYSSRVPMLWLEDVYLTGLVAKAADIKLKQVEKKLYVKRLSRRLYYGTTAFYIGANEKNMKLAWRGIKTHSEKVIAKINDRLREPGPR